MEYLIPFALVAALIGAFVLVVARISRSKGGAAHERGADDNRQGGAPGPGTDRATPLGDTNEHADEQSAGVETIGSPEAERSGGGRASR